jgi:hypothetical protein
MVNSWSFAANIPENGVPATLRPSIAGGQHKNDVSGYCLEVLTLKI